MEEGRDAEPDKQTGQKAAGGHWAQWSRIVRKKGLLEFQGTEHTNLTSC